MPQIRLHARRAAQLVVGVLLLGSGIGFTVRAQLGVSSWDVLGVGLARATGLEFGLVTILIGVVILLLWIPLRQKPGVGTLVNVLLVGTAAHIVLSIIPPVDHLALRIVMFSSGLLLAALGTGMYIGTHYGTGPRDGLMTGLHALTGLPIWIVRTLIELTVLGLGWFLGGNVGIGTIAFALCIGPLTQVTMKLFDLSDVISRASAVTDGAGQTDALEREADLEGTTVGRARGR